MKINISLTLGLVFKIMAKGDQVEEYQKEGKKIFSGYRENKINKAEKG